MTKVLEVPLYVNNWKSDIVKEIKQFELFGCCKCENLAQSIAFAGDSILILWHLPTLSLTFSATKRQKIQSSRHQATIIRTIRPLSWDNEKCSEENISSTGEIIVRFDRLGCFTFPRVSIIFFRAGPWGPIVLALTVRGSICQDPVLIDWAQMS